MAYNGLAKAELNMQTVTLTNGKVVLAKPYHGDLQPIRYANWTQANASAAKLGDGWIAWQGFFGRAIYVAKVSAS